MQLKQPTPAVIALLLIIVSVAGIAYVYGLPGNHTQISLTEERGDLPEDSIIVSYDSLTPTEQTVFRDELQTDDAFPTEIPTQHIEVLSHADAVTLDGITYRVTTDPGHRTQFIRMLSTLFLPLFFAGGALAAKGLNDQFSDAFDVVTGIWLIITAVILLTPWVLYSPPFGTVEPGISPSPVASEDISKNSVIDITALPSEKRTAVYDVIEGGAATDSQPTSLAAVPALQMSVIEDYTHLRSDSEYYALGTVDDYQKYSQGFIVLFGTLLSTIIGLSGVSLISFPLYKQAPPTASNE